MNMRMPVGVILLLLGLTLGVGWAFDTDTFSHLEHDGLFPLCEGCHKGFSTPDDRSDDFPDAAQCGLCHDDVREPRVEWRSPATRASLLDFDHVGHALASGDSTLDCRGCHTAGPDVVRMDVVPASGNRCLTCHAHEAEDHLDSDRDCAICHRTLVEVPELSPGRILEFPRPTTHDRDDFSTTHGQLALESPADRCATCHARESCTRCHANTPDPVLALQPDARVAALVFSKAPAYPIPDSHAETRWRTEHAPPTASADPTCANCHTTGGCRSCHVRWNAEDVPLDLPTTAAGDPRGALVSGDATMHDPGFVLGHGPAAVVRPESCASCHEQATCEGCHGVSGTTDFHWPNFLARHGPEAWGREQECAGCHSPQVFCRTCHAELGRTMAAGSDAVYHSREPLWLFGHGAAARQGLTGCQSCHTQTDCLRCHSAVGGWAVNPHGPGFDAERMRRANPRLCIACHLGGVGR